MNAIASLAQTLTGSTLTTAKKAPTLAQCKAEMTKQLAATQKGIASTMQAAVLLGEAAAHAKALVGHGKWGAWLAENFDAKGTWVRVCMRAAEAWHLLEKRPEPVRIAVLDKFNTVEKLADTLGVLDQGEDPLVTAPVKRSRAPNKLKRDDGPAQPGDIIDVASRDVPDTGKGANEHADLARREKALDKREKDLDARSAKLDTREQKLVLREAAVAQKEVALVAAAKAKPIQKPEAMGLKPDESIDDLKAKAKAASARAVKQAKPEAPAKPSPDAAKARKSKKQGSTKGAAENAPENELAQRAAETVANVQPDPMAVPGGMNPDADAATEVL